MIDVKIREIIGEEPPLLGENASLEAAAAVIRSHGKGAAVVVRDRKAVGILTERDVVRLLSEGTPADASVSPHLTRDVITIKEDRNIAHGLTLMAENGIRRLLVVDDEGLVLGMVDQGALIAHLEDDLFRAHLRLEQILSSRREVVTVGKYDSLRTAFNLMSSKNIGAVLVTEGGKPVGILSESDALKAAAERTDLTREVADFMSTPVVTVERGAFLVEIVKLMREKGIRRVVVVDDRGEPWAMLSQRDILRNIESDYNRFLERKLSQAKSVLSLFPEMVVEVAQSEGQQVVVWANKRAIARFGTELIDAPIHRIIPKKSWYEIYAALSEHEAVEAVAFEEGGRIYEASAMLIPGTSRDEGRMKVLLRDVTENVRLKEEIRGELDTYLRIMNATDDMIFLYHAGEGSIFMANGSTNRHLGYTEEEIKAMTIFQIIRESEAFLRKNIDKILLNDEVVRGRRTYGTKSGDTLPVEVTATKVKVREEDYILIVARDISEKIEMEKAIRLRNEQLKLFHRFNISLNRSSSTLEAFDILMFYLMEANLDLVHVYSINPSLTRISGTMVKQKGKLWLEDCLMDDVKQCKVIAGGADFLVESEKMYPCPHGRISPKVRSYLCKGVYSSGKLVALITLGAKTPDFFESQQTRLIDDLVNAFSLFISNLRLVEINKELSIRDPLTNLYNRRFTDEFFQKKYQTAKRKKHPISVLMIDLDNFKQLNDRHGHQAGDDTLVRAARRIDKSLRESDVVGRYGGEEFFVVLPEADRGKAREVGERIREEIRKPAGPGETELPQVTASIGLATFPEDGEGDDPFAIVKVADDRMYEAKHGGKDRVVG